MISLAEIVADPDFAQTYTINRSSGVFQLGKFVGTTTPLPSYGIIKPAKANELEQIPEGDRITGAITVHSTDQIFETNQGGLSDTVNWSGQNYKVSKVWPWNDFGYWKALLTRMSGV